MSFSSRLTDFLWSGDGLFYRTVKQEQVLKNAMETKKKSVARVADLEDKLKNSKTVRERELKQAEKDVDQTKKRYDQSIKKTKDKEQVSNGFIWLANVSV